MPIVLENTVHVIFSLGLFINAALFVPQVVKLLRQKHANDVSLITFGGFSILQIFTAWHGYLLNDYLLMGGILLSLLTCGTVTLLIVYYRLTSRLKGKNVV